MAEFCIPIPLCHPELQRCASGEQRRRLYRKYYRCYHTGGQFSEQITAEWYTYDVLVTSEVCVATVTVTVPPFVPPVAVLVAVRVTV